MIAWIRIHGVLCIRFFTLFFLAPVDCLCAVYVPFHHVFRILLWVCANKLLRMLRLMAEPVFFVKSIFCFCQFSSVFVVVFCVFRYLLQSRVQHKWGYNISFQLKFDCAVRSSALHSTMYNLLSLYCSVGFFGHYVLMILLSQYNILRSYFIFETKNLYKKKSLEQQKNKKRETHGEHQQPCHYHGENIRVQRIM